MIFDTHMHTKFSSDSKMKITEIIEKANSLNIGVTTTEHLDLAYPKENLFRADIKGYFNEYEKYRSDRLLLGIELGLSLTINEQNSVIANSNPFDYIIGSIHSVYDDDIFLGYGKDEPNKNKYFNTYLECMLDNISTYDDFDSLSHIDYPCRYNHFENKELIYKEHSDILDEIFKTLISKEKVIELNTKRLANKESFDCLLDLYKRYKELGGKYITLGSDSHTQKYIANNFDRAFNFIELSGLKPIYFKNRKAEYMK